MGNWRKEDPDPTQSNDEIASNLVEVFDNINKTWQAMYYPLVYPQEYCEAEVVDDLVVVVGDWPRNSNPPQTPAGIVQIFNLTNNTWYSGTNMLQQRGLGAMAEAGGYLYYAGGISPKMQMMPLTSHSGTTPEMILGPGWPI